MKFNVDKFRVILTLIFLISFNNVYNLKMNKHTFDLNLSQIKNSDFSHSDSINKIHLLLDNIKIEQIKTFENLQNTIGNCKLEVEYKRKEYLQLYNNFSDLKNKTDLCKTDLHNEIQTLKLLENEENNLKFTIDNSEKVRIAQSQKFYKNKKDFEEILNILEEFKLSSMINNSNDKNDITSLSSKIIVTFLQTGMISKASTFLNEISKNNSSKNFKYNSFLQTRNDQTEFTSSINIIISEINKTLELFNNKENNSINSFNELKSTTSKRFKNTSDKLNDSKIIYLQNKKCLDEGEPKLKDLEQSKYNSLKVYENSNSVCNSFEKEYEIANSSYKQRIDELNNLKNIILKHT